MSKFRSESGAALPGSVLTDPLLPPLTLDQAELFRAKVAPQLEQFDPSALLLGDHARLADHTTLPFDVLARRCGQSPEVAWDDIIRGHFMQVATHAESVHRQSRSIADRLRSSPTCYLFASGQPPSDATYCADYFATGLNVALSTACQGAIAVASGALALNVPDQETWLSTGRANLLDLTVTQDFVVTKNSSASGDLFAVTSSSPYTASAAIVLSQAVRHWTGVCLDKKSVLFAVPAQDLLLFQMVNATTVRSELPHVVPELMRHTVGAFRAAPAPLSASGFLWHNDMVQRVSYVQGNALQVFVPSL